MATDSRDSDHRFDPIRRALAVMDSPAMDPPWSDLGRLSAAVALVLRGGGDLEVLLMKRARSARDPWSGQISLPGGRREASDSTLHHTAVRETLEEVGLDLSDASLLGRMEDLRPGTKRLPISTISPFVFGTPSDATAHVASREVANILWAPIPDLADPRARSTVEIPLPEGPRTFPCFRVQGEIVWGLTYRILNQFLVVYGSSADLHDTRRIDDARAPGDSRRPGRS